MKIFTRVGYCSEYNLQNMEGCCGQSEKVFSKNSIVKSTVDIQQKV